MYMKFKKRKAMVIEEAVLSGKGHDRPSMMLDNVLYLDQGHGHTGINM